jgi:hypothetical protein
MPDFDVTDVTRIARQAVREQSLPIHIVGAVLGTGGSDYVEILVNIMGCADDPCQISLGVFRNVSEASLMGEISTRLRRHLDDHRSGPDDLDRVG